MTNADNRALAEIFDEPGEMDLIEAGAKLRLTGIRLGEIRRQLGLTQAEVAGRMGVSQRRVSAIEQGEPLSTETGTISAYAEALGGHLEMTLALPDGGRFPLLDVRRFPLAG